MKRRVNQRKGKIFLFSEVFLLALQLIKERLARQAWEQNATSNDSDFSLGENHSFSIETFKQMTGSKPFYKWQSDFLSCLLSLLSSFPSLGRIYIFRSERARFDDRGSDRSRMKNAIMQMTPIQTGLTSNIGGRRTLSRGRATPTVKKERKVNRA